MPLNDGTRMHGACGCMPRVSQANRCHNKSAAVVQDRQISTR